MTRDVQDHDEFLVFLRLLGGIGRRVLEVDRRAELSASRFFFDTLRPISVWSFLK